MAPIKRARLQEDEGFVEYPTAAGSSSRRDSRKRPRLSDQTSGGDDTDETVADGNEARGPSTQNLSSTQKVDFEQLRRDAASDSSDDEVHVAREAKRIKNRRAQNTESLPAECGVIESVTCINFMCHTKLQVNLGPQVNFIIGHNGSGKSAVLTALTLCLGGKATNTNRGQNLKSFIKEGEESSILSVKIKNQGMSAYLPETYGDSIIVERHFNKAGASGFKIKNANGRIITTKKAELDEICDFYALQLDNPINVLTQDMARQFLNSSSPHEKYKFFIKGVQLEQLDQDYVMLQESVDNIEWTIDDKGDDLKALKQKMRRAEERQKQSARHESLRDLLRVLRRQAAWAQVEMVERDLKKQEAILERIHEKITDRQRESLQSDAAYEQSDVTHNQLTETVAEEKLAQQPLIEEHAQVKERWEQHRTEMQETIAEQRKIRELLNNATKVVTRTNSEIAAERERLEVADGGSQANRLQEIDDAQSSLEEQIAEKNRHAAGLPALENKAVEAEDTVKKLQPIIKAKRDELTQAERRLGDLNKDRNQQESAYNPRLPSLLRAIQAESRFRDKPVGPMGYHIQLTKPEWSSILERTFGGSLNSFVVTSKQDQTLLNELMRKTQCNSPIYISKPGRIDVSRNEPDPIFDTILRILNIDNDLVRNQLIINNAVENTILIKSRAEGVNVMDAEVRPKNVKACLTMHDHFRADGIRLYYGRGGFATAPIRMWTDKPRMKTDIEAQISIAKEILQGLKQETRELEQRLRSYQEAQKQAVATVNKHKMRSRQLNLEVQRAEDNVQRLKDELDQDTPQDGKLDALKDALKEAEDEENTYRGQNTAADEAREKVSAAGREIKAKLEALSDSIKEVETKIKKAQGRLHNQADKRSAALREKNAAHQAIADAERDKTEQEEVVQAHAENVTKFIDGAGQVSPRVPVPAGETLKTIEMKMTKSEAELHRYEQQIGGDQEQIAAEVLSTTTAYRHAQHALDKLQDLAYNLKQSLEERNNRWILFRQYITLRTRSAFVVLLSERAFRGSMNVSHRNQTLDLQVEPDITRAAHAHAAGRSTKTLSGGEKSFSTICMLLALWDAMGSPIRCLDEFDVFMDAVNRDVSVRMMIGAARATSGRQTILITPQAMGNVPVGPDVKIIKLSDPERGQRVLDL